MLDIVGGSAIFVPLIHFVLHINAPSLTWTTYIPLFFNYAQIYKSGTPWWTFLYLKMLKI